LEPGPFVEAVALRNEFYITGNLFLRICAVLLGAEYKIWILYHLSRFRARGDDIFRDRTGLIKMLLGSLVAIL